MRLTIDLKALSGVKHCHARGVHSVVTEAGEDGRLRRVFVAMPEHELWRNAPGRGPMSVGYHSHARDLELTALAGFVDNWLLVPGDDLKLAGWRYRSHLRGEVGGFDRLSPVHGYGVVCRPLVTKLWLPAWVRHTIFVSRGKSAAWLVEEGDADPHYDPVTLTDADLSHWSPEGLYEPMTADEALALLRGVAELEVRS